MLGPRQCEETLPDAPAVQFLYRANQKLVIAVCYKSGKGRYRFRRVEWHHEGHEV